MYPIKETPQSRSPDDGSGAGPALRRLRTRVGISLREVQRRCGVSAARLSRIENGYVDPRLSTVEAILGALDAGFADFAAEFSVASGRPDGGHRPASPMNAVLRSRSRIHDVLAARGASHPRIFGSVARGTSGPESDLDILVDLEAGRTLFDLAALRSDLEELLGVRVDVVPSAGLDGEVRAEILAEAIEI